MQRKTKIHLKEETLRQKKTGAAIESRSKKLNGLEVWRGAVVPGWAH